MVGYFLDVSSYARQSVRDGIPSIPQPSGTSFALPRPRRALTDCLNRSAQAGNVRGAPNGTVRLSSCIARCLAAALLGGMGFAGWGNIHPTRCASASRSSYKQAEVVGWLRAKDAAV